ncbi:MAG TPA: hypothetical protein VKZ18_27835 [Polyangia bacterium]|nr:hypothetical protein [Polyangia bacterium]
MRLDDACGLADAVLRLSRARLRWQLGVLAPRAWSEGGGGDPWWQETQCLVSPTDPTARLEGKVRFIQLRRRQPNGDPRLSGDDEGELRAIDLDFSLAALAAGGERVVSFRLVGGTEEAGAFAFQKWPIFGAVKLAAEPIDNAERPIVRLRVRIENVTAWVLAGENRERALRGSLLGAHLLLGLAGGTFVSLLDPPAWAADAAAACRSVGTYPVLAGEPDRDDLLLSTPILLADHPRPAQPITSPSVAAEGSPG